jgi:DNA-binding LacI/PurR family transcriptional regulator
VRVPIAALGERATQLVLKAVEEGSAHRKKQETLPTALIVRASCGSKTPDREGNAPGV